MPEVRIPDELTAQFERIVEILYDGDEELALETAIEKFIHHELKRLPSGQKFEHLMGKRMEIEADKERYSDQRISSAFDKVTQRKKRLESFDLGKKKAKD